MKKNLVISLLVGILVLAVPNALAEDPEELEKARCGKCSPAGIFYGGAELDEEGLFFKWILNVTPEKNGRYLISAYAGWGAGVPIATPMNGTSVRIGRNKYEFFGIGYQNTDDSYPPLNPPIIIAVHGYMQMIDCDTLRAEYDFQGIYAWGMEPFVDPPLDDLGFWSEDYKRLENPEWPPDW